MYVLDQSTHVQYNVTIVTAYMVQYLWSFCVSLCTYSYISFFTSGIKHACLGTL